MEKKKPPTFKVIIDQAFYVMVDTYEYTLYKTGSHNALGHYSKLEYLTVDLARHMMLERNREAVVTLKQFIEEYKSIETNIKNLIK